MIIEIEDKLYLKVLEILKGRSIKVYDEVKNLKPLELNNNTLNEARKIKTHRIKENIKETIKELLKSNTSPTKYQIHKKTGIAYTTLKKYYNEILKEVTNDH